MVPLRAVAAASLPPLEMNNAGALSLLFTFSLFAFRWYQTDTTAKCVRGCRQRCWSGYRKPWLLETGLYTALAGHNLGLMRCTGLKGAVLALPPVFASTKGLLQYSEDVFQVQSDSPCSWPCASETGVGPDRDLPPTPDGKWEQRKASKGSKAFGSVGQARGLILTERLITFWSSNVLVCWWCRCLLTGHTPLSGWGCLEMREKQISPSWVWHQHAATWGCYSLGLTEKEKSS